VPFLAFHIKLKTFLIYVASKEILYLDGLELCALYLAVNASPCKRSVIAVGLLVLPLHNKSSLYVCIGAEEAAAATRAEAVKLRKVKHAACRVEDPDEELVGTDRDVEDTNSVS
jgi:hypothetical protein